jgi:hypothetical protein
MHSVFINCAQTVFERGQKAVGTRAQFPHQVSTFFNNLRVLHTLIQFFVDVMRADHTWLSTRNFWTLPLEIGWLYPVSTQPTITTTIYINRRGAAQ